MSCRSSTDPPPGLRVLVVGDLPAAREVYCDLLGLALLRASGRGLLLGTGIPPVPAISVCPAASLRPAGSRRLIHALLAAQGGSWVQVATSDLEATLERLTAHGAPILQAAEEAADGSRAGAALDPWDNTLRLVQRPAMNTAARRPPTR